MATFDIAVDTDPMALTMGTVGVAVSGVNESVEQMRDAIVSQEQQAAQLICNNVDNGFFMLMKSQLSQKIASCASVMASKLLLMKKYSQDIKRLQDLMTNDYNRIFRRYKKQFTALDKALQTRVHTLDKAAFELSKTFEQFMDGARDGGAKAFVCADETNIVNVKLSSAKMKKKAQKALNAMGGNIEQSATYNKKVVHILDNKVVDTKEETYIPSMVTEGQSMFNRDNTITNVYLPKSELLRNSEIVSNTVVGNVFEHKEGESGNFEWRDVSKSDKEAVTNAFVKEVTNANLDERVAKHMMRLIEQSSWKAVSESKGEV